MVIKNGLIELDFSNDSLFTNQLTTDFVLKEGSKEQKSKYRKEILNYKILLILKRKQDTGKFSGISILNFENGKWFQLAWNSIDTMTLKIDEMLEIHEFENKKLYGYYFFSEEYITTLLAGKSIEKMTLESFKNYAIEYVNLCNETNEEFEKINIGYISSPHYFQISTQALLKTGYNPIQNFKTINTLYEKYYNIPEVQEIFNKRKTK